MAVLASCSSHRPCGLTGGYEAQTRGGAREAMEDSRGGAAEVLAAREAPQNLYEIPEKALQKGSLLGCSFEGRGSPPPCGGPHRKGRTSRGGVHVYLF